LFARASGYGSTNQQVEATDTQTNSLQLPPFVLKVADQKVEGQVLDAAGKPATGARVNVTGNGQPAGASATTDSNGHFLIEHVCEGAIRVSASLQSDAARVPPVTGNTQAQAGDVNVVVKLGAPQG
jgi:phosphatidate phosphatase APP1